MIKVLLNVAMISLTICGLNCGLAQAESHVMVGEVMFGAAAYSPASVDDDYIVSPQSDDKYAPANLARDNHSLADPDLELRYGGRTGIKYRSNIYRQKNGATSDFVGVVAPAFAVRSDFERHAVQVKGRVEAGYYASEQNNNYVNADLQGNSRIDVAQGEYVDLHGSAKYDNVEIGGFIEDLDNPQNRAAEPISYKFANLGADYSKPLGQLFGQNFLGKTGAEAQIYDYDNTQRQGGTKLVQDDRDRNEYYGYGLLGMPLIGGLMPFVSVDANARIYHRQVERTAIYGRDSAGIGVYIGAQWNNRQVDFAWASGKIGYMNQNYNESALPDVHELGFNFEGAMMVAPNTSLQAIAFRKVNENALLGASGALQTRGQIGAIHRINDAWELDATGRYTLVDFQINPSFGRVGRKDDIYDGGFGVNYYIANPLYMRADYQYIQRHSTLNLANYNENRMMLSVGLKY